LTALSPLEPEASNGLTPTFLLSYRDLMVPRSQNSQTQIVIQNSQTQIVGQRPQHFITQNYLITQKLPATSTKLKINMQSKRACCLQKSNFRHILACH